MSKQKQKERIDFRIQCLTRDNFSCKVCGFKDSIETLEVHHIQNRNLIPGPKKYTKENGITLCPICHMKAELWWNNEANTWYTKEEYQQKYPANEDYLLYYMGNLYSLIKSSALLAEKSSY